MPDTDLTPPPTSSEDDPPHTPTDDDPTPTACEEDPLPTACEECLRTSWLLGALNDHLDRRRGDYQRLVGLLELEPLHLIERIGADERSELRERYLAFQREWLPDVPGVLALCRHDPDYPRLLVNYPGAPAVLHIAAPIERFRSLLSEPAVAIVGSRAPTDYGSKVAHGLAAQLARAGATVVSDLAYGIASSALAGALYARGRALTVMPGGVDICYPNPERPLYDRLIARGCAISELPCSTGVRQWSFPARNRIVAAIAKVMVVVETGDDYGGMMLPTLALAAGRDVAAVPGPITSPESRGAHALLADGAQLVRGAQDVLDLLYGVGPVRPQNVLRDH